MRSMAFHLAIVINRRSRFKRSIARMVRQSSVTSRQLRSNRNFSGPAVLGLRAQIDRHRYPQLMQTEIVHQTPNLYVVEAAVEDLIISESTRVGARRRVDGCILDDGTVGVFLFEGVARTRPL